MNDSKPHSPITVTPAAEPDTYIVDVQARSTTQHRVTITPAYLEELGVDALPAADVLHEAFRFLLEREPNTSVLARFDLRDIERYFPEFRSEIARRLRG